MQISSVEELKSDLARHGPRPVYAVLGPEQYLVRQAFALLKETVVPEGLMSLNFAEFSAPDDPAPEFLAAANTFPMMSPRRMVVVRNVEKLQEGDRDALIRYLQAPAAKTVLVLVGTEIDRRTVLYRTVRDSACIVEFPLMKGEALKHWAGEYIRRRGHTISPPSLEKVAELAGSSLEAVANEIEKLLLYAGTSKEIPPAAVDDLVQGSRQHRIFELTDAMGARDKPLALKVLANLLDADENPIGVAAMMARHFRQILIARETLAAGRSPGEAADAAQVPAYPSVRQAFLRHLRLIDAETAARVHRELAALDQRFKSSTGNPRMLLEKLICAL